MIPVISLIASSKTPCVEGYVTINPPKMSLFSSATFLSSSTFMLPFSSQLVTTTLKPAITAEAGFVPCADEGIIIIFL